MRQRNYSIPETVTRVYVGQLQFDIAVTQGYAPGNNIYPQYWIWYHEENKFRSEIATLLDGAKIIGAAIRDTVLSDNNVFLRRLRDNTLLIVSSRYRVKPSEYYAISTDVNGDTEYGVYDAEANTFTNIFDLAQNAVRSKTPMIGQIVVE